MTRVLLVEDSTDVLYVLQIELEWIGYQVDPAPNAATALQFAQRNRPDVIVSDLYMPETDGLEFIRLIREIPGLASVPAIALTGASLSKNLKQALSFGFAAHITKPVEAGDLATQIERLTARRLERKAS